MENMDNLENLRDFWISLEIPQLDPAKSRGSK
jgi:hypothetical protein